MKSDQPGGTGEELTESKRTLVKSPDAFRTISEVAVELDLPQHVLRFWETRFPQVRPLKRGGSRRYYRPEDVDILRRIRRLLYDEGYTIKGVQRLLKEPGARAALRDATRIPEGTRESPAKAPPPEAASDPKAVLIDVLEDLRRVRNLLQRK